jgi:Tol biopolymer transport system component
MKCAVHLALATVVMLGTPSIARPQRGADRFQQALKKERVDGDLKGAIALYQQILKEQAADRSLSAKVLLQLGSAYEKQGNADATAAYQRIVRDYADQTEAASAARARLATLSPTAVASRGTTVRRIWVGSDVVPDGAPTRDGRLLPFVAWGGDLAVHDLTTGQNRNITNKGAGEVAFKPVPSPDGRRVAYTWYHSKHAPEVRIIGMDGGPFRILFSNPEVAQVTVSDWSPDGKFILTSLVRRDHSSQIALISTDDGSLRVLQTLDYDGPGKMGISPDGKYVVYDRRPNDSTAKRDVYVLAVDGSSDNVLVKHPADDRAIGWSPDGRYVLFSSDRTGTDSFWLMPVAGGKAAGEPVLVRRDVEPTVRPMGFTSDGALMFATAGSLADMRVATIDPTTGKLIGQPTLLIDNFVGMNLGLEWSPGGSEFAFMRWGPPAPGSRLIARSLATGFERVVPVTLTGMSGTRWTPDGRGLVVKARDFKGRDGYFLVDLATGGSTMLLEGKRNWLGGWADGGKSLIYRFDDSSTRTLAILRRDVASGDTSDVFRYTVGAGKPLDAFGLDQAEPSPDGKSVVFLLRTDTSGSSLHIVPAGGGESRELFRSPVGQETSWFRWSPDGKSLALLLRTDTSGFALRIVPTSGGETRELVRGPAGQDVGGFTWSVDSRHIFFAQGPDPGGSISLTVNGMGGSAIPPRARVDTTPKRVMRISVAGGAPEETGIIATHGLVGLLAHPDGTRIAFEGSHGRARFDVWVMENFLPKAEAANKNHR